MQCKEFQTLFVHLSQWWDDRTVENDQVSWCGILNYIVSHSDQIQDDHASILINYPHRQDLPNVEVVAVPIDDNADTTLSAMTTASIDTSSRTNASKEYPPSHNFKRAATPAPAPTPHKIKTPRILLEADSNSAKELFSEASDYDLKISADETKKVTEEQTTIRSQEETKRVTEQELTKREEQATKQAQEKTKQLQLQLELAKLQQSKPSEVASKVEESNQDSSNSEAAVPRSRRAHKMVDRWEDMVSIKGKRFPTLTKLGTIFKPVCRDGFELIGKAKEFNDNGTMKQYKTYSCKCGNTVRIRVVKNNDVYTVQRANDFSKHENGRKVVPLLSSEEP